ncbi:alpha/beta hydrolase [Rhodococcus sp. NPDC055024]
MNQPSTPLDVRTGPDAAPDIVHIEEAFGNPSIGATAQWLPVYPPDYRIAYDRSAIEESTGLTFGNLRLPSTDPGPDGYPVVVVIHGGAWTSDWSCDYMEPFAESLTRLGLATWSIEYRRPGQFGSAWPTPALDVAHATDFVRRLATALPLDPRRVVVSGHSAGGHLAAWIASRHKLPESSALHAPDPLPVLGVVALDPWALDMHHDMANEVDSHSAQRSWLMEFLGATTPEDAVQRIEADGVSPTQLLPIGVPIDIVTGTGAFPGNSERYAYAAAAAGDTVTLTVMNGAQHFDYPDPWGPAWPPIARAILGRLGETRTAGQIEQARPPAQRRIELG